MKAENSVLPVVLLFCLINVYTDCASVMSVDLGSEFMKVAIVMPGVPMEVVPDGDSKRKTTTTIGFRENQRLFGSEAANLANRQPEMVFERVPALLGKRPDHPTVILYQEWYPYHNLTFNETTGQIVLLHTTGVQYTAEELVGMLLDHAKDNAERYISSDVRSCVVTVPAHYGQAERRSLFRAAGLAGLEILQLMNANTAVALNYGIFRRNHFSVAAQNILFFDVGSMSSTVTVVSYHVGKHRDRGTTAEDPILTILGVAPVPHLGTTFIIRRLSDHLAKQFVSLNKVKNAEGIFDNSRSMAKLRSEASRVLNQLSANTEVFAQVEHLFDGQDFRVKVTRSQLEELCADYFNALQQPFQEALRFSKLDMGSISDVILMGGGTRIPKIQENLKRWSGRELGRGVNGDEAAVLGSVYQAAAQTLGFKVLPFVVRDYNLYPIAIDFSPAPSSGDPETGEKTEEAVEDSSPFIRRLLFPRANPFPQKRSITFSRHTVDLDFYVNYVNLQVDEVEYLKTSNLSRVDTAGVTETITKAINSEARGVKAHFSMDGSGILWLTRVECLFQTIEKPVVEAESTLTKLGNTIGDLLGVGKSSGEGGEAAANATAGEAADSTPDAGDKKPVTGDKPGEQVNQTMNSTTPKGPVTYFKSVNFTLVHLDLAAPTKHDVEVSISRLDNLRVVALEQQYLEHAVNELETAILYVRSELDTAEFIRHTTEAERNQLSDVNAKASDWYDEQSSTTPREHYESKLDDINRLLLPIKLRLAEAVKRPSALSVLEKAVSESQGIVTRMKQMNSLMQRLAAETLAANATSSADSNKTAESPGAAENATESAGASGEGSAGGGGGASNETETKPPSTPAPLPTRTEVFTDNEISEVEASVLRVKEWLEDGKSKLEKSAPTERPLVLAEEMIEKKQHLNRVVLPYYRRLQHWQTELENRMKTVAAASAQQTPKPEEKPSQQHQGVDLPSGFNDITIEVPSDGAPTPPSSDDKRPPHEDL